MPEAALPPSHVTLATPNPSERGLLVIVPDEVFLANGGVLPAEGTSYAACAETFFSGDYRASCENYIYTGQIGERGMGFGINKTVEEANTPFRTTTWKGNHRWPPILLALVIVEDYGAPRSFTTYDGTNLGTGFGPTYYDRVVYIPDVAEGTRFVKDEFFAPTPFNIPQTPVPVPTSVTYSLPGGVNGNFQECLHPTITIPPAITATSQIVSGTTAGIGTALEGQTFPATNFEEWSPYVLSDNQELQGGGWYRVRIRVFPPAQPEAIVQ